MARDVYTFTVTIPANTAQSSPVTIDTSFPPAVVQAIDIVVPPGPSGLMGFQLWVKGGQAIPINKGAWIIRDNWHATWHVQDQPDSGAWQVVGYNTDIYDHTVSVDFLIAAAGKGGADTAAVAAAGTAARLLRSGAG